MDSNTNTLPQAVERPALRSGDLSSETVLARLMTLDSTQRAHAYVQANSWDWPDAIADLIPGNWALLDNREKYAHPAQRALMRVLDATTTEFERSRQWWRESLGRTDEAHLEWWHTHYSSPNEKVQPRG